MNKNNNSEDFITLCRLIYVSYNIPIVCFNTSQQILSYNCHANGLEDLFLKIAIETSKSETTTLVNADIGSFGVIVAQNNYIVTGPFINNTLNDEIIDKTIKRYQLQVESKSILKNILSTIPSISLNSFLNYLCLINYLFTKKEIIVIDFLKNKDKVLKIAEKQTNEIFNESDLSHGTYSLEQRILSYVKEGDVDGITSFFKQMSQNLPPVEGKLADDELRQAKNVFIGFVALIGKDGAIKGNLDIEQTYQLIDLYTQECEKCTTVEQVNELRFNAIMDFTNRVAELRHPTAYSEEVYSALQFIKSHTNQPIGVMDVVQHVGKSRSYFLARFKQETGETIAHSILKAKLQESKLLLRYSDRSLVEISEFLYFSNQSHFQNLFKKEYGITPLTYRKQRF